MYLIKGIGGLQGSPIIVTMKSIKEIDCRAVAELV